MAETQAPANPPNNTVYVKNLDERVKLPDLISNLRSTFDVVGEVVDIIAKRNLKAKGQAFIVFEDAETAETAIESLQDFELFGKPMKLAFAKSRSDKTVERENGAEALEQHKRERLAEKDRKKALEEEQRGSNKRSAAQAGMANNAATANKKTTATNAIQEDEYLPPNKTILLRDVDETYGKTELTSLFNQFPGFKEVRMVPTRPGIAFVEYFDEEGSIAAKQALGGKLIGSKPVRITYQKA